MTLVRLVVVDDHALFRTGLVSLLSDMPGLKIVGEASNGLEALNVIQDTEPDVVLLDVNLPGMNGVELVRILRQRETRRLPNLSGSRCHVLMLTKTKQDDDLFGAISAGADGFILKNADPEDFCRAIIEISEGKSVLSSEITQQVIQAAAGTHKLIVDVELSKREIEVVECLALAKTTSQIATDLFVTENTVKTHVRHILKKLNASNRAEAVRKAIQIRIIHKPG
jgi:DNA-binding NarL/FixJ family response regulator